MDAVRKAITGAESFEAAAQAVLEIGARWTPDAFAALLSQALDLSGLEGREAAFGDGETAFAEPSFTRQAFREQIDFLTQKRGKPTRAWTEAMQGDHDRAFVVAGVTDMAMLEEFQQAINEGAQTYDIKAFGKEFDRLVEKYGWDYNGGRDWRVRTIFETNIRTSYMAGRLRQMRDPDMVKIRPYWQYLHADTRVPLNPREEHVAFDRIILLWNDPWWKYYFPPNDWLCSCGVRTLSRGDLRRMGKSGPDQSPPIKMRPYLHKATGTVVDLPEGIGYGWDYMPGDLWEQGLVPSAILNEGGAVLTGDLKGHHVVSIDTPDPMAELRVNATAFRAKVLPDGLTEEAYWQAFLKPFGADPGKAVLWEDAAGQNIVISEQLFLEHSGRSKTFKRGRGDYAALLAEAIMNPDEIWLGVRSVPVDEHPGYEELMVTRRYIKVDPETSLYVMYELGRKAWGAITGYASMNRAKPDYRHIDKQRVGKLLFKRKKRPG